MPDERGKPGSLLISKCSILWGGGDAEMLCSDLSVAYCLSRGETTLHVCLYVLRILEDMDLHYRKCWHCVFAVANPETGWL